MIKYRGLFNINNAVLFTAVFTFACGNTRDVSVSDETAHEIISCPGEIECECQSDADCKSNFCSQANTCTIECSIDEDCPRKISGESCLGESADTQGVCGVVCTGTESGGCIETGMLMSSCINFSGTYVCGYSQAIQNQSNNRK